MKSLHLQTHCWWRPEENNKSASLSSPVPARNPRCMFKRCVLFDGAGFANRRKAWLRAVEADHKAIWILKPPANSCGRGIRVFNRAAAGTIRKSKKCVVQVSARTAKWNACRCRAASGMCKIF